MSQRSRSKLIVIVNIVFLMSAAVVRGIDYDNTIFRIMTFLITAICSALILSRVSEIHDVIDYFGIYKDRTEKVIRPKDIYMRLSGREEILDKSRSYININRDTFKIEQDEFFDSIDDIVKDMAILSIGDTLYLFFIDYTDENMEKLKNVLTYDAFNNRIKICDNLIDISQIITEIITYKNSEQKLIIALGDDKKYHIMLIKNNG